MARTVWCSNNGDGTISKINPLTNAVLATVTVGAGPRKGCSDATHLWVPNFNAGTVSKVDPVSNTVVATVTGVGTNPSCCIWDGNYIWVTDNNGGATGSIYKIDPGTNSVVASIVCGLGPFNGFWDGSYLWICNNGANVVKIDTLANTIVATITTAVGPLDICAVGGYIWMVNYSASSVSKIDPGTNAIIATITTGINNPYGCCSDGTNLWVGNYGGNLLTKINPVTNATISTLAVTHPVLPNFDGTNIWVANDSTTIQKIDPVGVAILATVTVGNNSYSSWMSPVETVTTKTQSGKANIRATTTKTQLGKGSIAGQVIKTLLGKSRIAAPVGKLIPIYALSTPNSPSSQLTLVDPATHSEATAVQLPFINNRYTNFSNNVTFVGSGSTTVPNPSVGDFAAGGWNFDAQAAGIYKAYPGLGSGGSTGGTWRVHLTLADNLVAAGRYRIGAKLFIVKGAAQVAVDFTISSAVTWSSFISASGGVTYSLDFTIYSSADVYVAPGQFLYLMTFINWSTAEGGKTIFLSTNDGARSYLTTPPFLPDYVSSKDIAGRASIRFATTKTQPGKGNIQAVTTKLQLGKAKLVVIPERSILGTADIMAVTTRTQLGKASVVVLGSHTWTGKSSMVLRSIKTILGKSAINNLVTRNLLGRSRVTGRTARDQYGTSRIATPSDPCSCDTTTANVIFQFGATTLSIKNPELGDSTGIVGNVSVMTMMDGSIRTRRDNLMPIKLVLDFIELTRVKALESRDFFVACIGRTVRYRDFNGTWWQGKVTVDSISLTTTGRGGGTSARKESSSLKITFEGIKS